MNRLIRNLAVVGAGAYVVWGLARWLDHERRHGHQWRKREIDTWEGEGGNLTPHEQLKVSPQNV
jgi:hypothetical protein